MKHYLFALLFLIGFSTVFAQDDDIISRMPPPPMERMVTKKCSDAKDDMCSRKEVHKAVYKFLHRSEKKQLIENAKKDTIKILTILSIDKDKNIVKKESSLKFFEKNTKELSQKANARISKIRLKAKAPTKTSHAQFFEYLCFRVDKKNRKLIPLYDYIPPRPEFKIIDTPPIFPGCEIFEAKRSKKDVCQRRYNNMLGKNSIQI